MNTLASDFNEIKNLYRIEDYPLEELKKTINDITRPTYSHDEVYGQYCTIEEYINCPPEKTFAYLADGNNLIEWTYSLRHFHHDDQYPDQVVGSDIIGDNTKIHIKTVSNKEAMTVDYHCAWDQGDELWMIYLMRVIPAQTVLKKPGSVVLWTNCHHPYYDKNPFPETAPKTRPVWVGDLWSMFYAGHYLEMQNAKHILEYRHQQSLKNNQSS